MAAQQIPHGNQGLRSGMRRNGTCASPRAFGRRGLFERKSPAKRRFLRRNGLVRVQFPSLRPDFARSRGMNPAAQRHIPVLGRQAVEMLAPRDGGIYVDATFGAGGYSRVILETPAGRVLGIDRDRSAVLAGF